MALDLWEYRPGSHHAADLTLVGYDVEATDGPLGHVDQDAGDHLLVDTRPWVPGAPILVPVGLVARIDHLELVVHLDCPRARVRSAPPPSAVDRTGGEPAGLRGRRVHGVEGAHQVDGPDGDARRDGVQGLTAASRAALDAHYAPGAARRTG
ncbi:hypothetical protein ACFP3U_32720 [Kitasatospora misakiensis]|uniref:PRC-barrel domain-containing protein n=1 Tax=Kitasatospora misakiensis TaxID=67330 RepID=A0ABW0XD04_9ACTN